MIIYYAMLLLLALASYEFKKIKPTKKTKKTFLLLCWILLSTVQGLRGFRVGSDTPMYVNHFNGLVKAKFEIGYELLVQIIRMITSNPTIFLIITAMIINGLVILGIGYLSPNPALSVYCYVTLYYYFNSYNAQRQYIAVGIVMVAFCMATKRKWLFAFLLVTLAMTFHSTAFIGYLLCVGELIIYRIEKRRINSRKLFGLPDSPDDICLEQDLTVSRWNERLFLFVVVIMAFLISSQLDKLVNLLLQLFPRYQIYTMEGYGKYLTGQGGIQQPVVYSLILMAYYCLVPNGKIYKLRYIIPIGIAVVLAVLQKKTIFAGRFLWYFDIFSIIAIPQFVSSKKMTRPSRRAIHFVMLVICLAFMSYYLLQDGMVVKNYTFSFT